jgi:hypothetical protein
MIDVLLQAKTEKETENQLLILRSLLKDGDLLPSLFMKQVVGLATNEAKVGRVDRAINLLARLPDDFFDDLLPKLLVSDKDFCDQAAILAGKIQEEDHHEIRFRYNEPNRMQWKMGNA